MITPLVSVIIPNYCHAKYLEQRIQSVLSQTYTHFEVIILDDCSPDDGASRTIIEKYQTNQHISHIMYNEKNSGSTFRQWRKGFELAKGELIWIAESDDYCDCNFLSSLVPLFDKYSECSLVQCSSKRVDSEGYWIDYNTNYNHKIEYSDGVDFIKSKLIVSNFFIPNASAVLFRKDCVFNIPQDYVNFRSAGDRLFWIYLLERGGICQLNTPINYFRQHEVKVSNLNEQNGIQSKENYAINQYLHKKGYVQGILYIDEYLRYWNYLYSFPFETEQIRQELIQLWFPWWKRTKLFHYISKVGYIIYNKVKS